MERQFEAELQSLKSRILTMGGSVREAVALALQALIERKPELLSKVQLLEEQIDQAHVSVDEACLRLLARQSPLAADLRLVVSIIKMNTDLERMGDQAFNISLNARRYLAEPELKPLVDLPLMAKVVKGMIEDSLNAFVSANLILAREVVGRDDQVDRFKDLIFRELLGYMAKDPQAIERGMNLILITRNLERLGDHATNIAEEVIFAISGEDIRHGKLRSPPKTNT